MEDVEKLHEHIAPHMNNSGAMNVLDAMSTQKEMEMHVNFVGD